MADGRSSDQPAPWRYRYPHNRVTGSTDSIPTATIVLAGGDSIILKHATSDQISDIFRAVSATRNGSNETDFSEDSTTTTQTVP